jgi:hypothetical protein
VQDDRGQATTYCFVATRKADVAAYVTFLFLVGVERLIPH